MGTGAVSLPRCGSGRSPGPALTPVPVQDDDAFALASAPAADSSLSAAPRAEAPGSSASAPASEQDEDAMSWIRGIPVIGESIANSQRDAEKPFEPVRDEDRVSAEAAPKVKVSIYMEAACPGCQFFTTHVLVPVMQEEGMSSITDLNIIPAGNAEVKVDEESKKEVVQCQHGEGECEGNKIISCLAKKYKESPAFVPALGCIEEHSNIASDVFSTLLSNVTAVDMLRNNAGICLANAKIDATEVEACSSSPEGDAMLREAIQETASLKPAFEYAPWVLVDDRALKDDAYSLKKYICESYTGPLPEACDSTKLKDYFPDNRSPVLAEDRDGSSKGSSKTGLKEGSVRGSNKLFKTLTGETTRQARQDIDRCSFPAVARPAVTGAILLNRAMAHAFSSSLSLISSCSL